METEPIIIFFFGDSICFGQGVSLHKGWVTQLAIYIDKIAADYNKEFIIINSSVNGRTTRQALENMQYELQSHNPTILIVQYGMNDCNYWETDYGNPRVSPKSFEANLEEIICRAISLNTKYIILNTNHPSGRTINFLPHTSITYEQSNKKYNEIIRKVAKNQGDQVILNDMEEIFNSYSNDSERLNKLLLPDKLHLSENGHNLYFKSICPIIEKLIRKILNS